MDRKNKILIGVAILIIAVACYLLIGGNGGEEDRKTNGGVVPPNVTERPNQTYLFSLDIKYKQYLPQGINIHLSKYERGLFKPNILLSCASSISKISDNQWMIKDKDYPEYRIYIIEATDKELKIYNQTNISKIIIGSIELNNTYADDIDVKKIGCLPNIKIFGIDLYYDRGSITLVEIYPPEYGHPQYHGLGWGKLHYHYKVVSSSDDVLYSYEFGIPIMRSVPPPEHPNGTYYPPVILNETYFRVAPIPYFKSAEIINLYDSNNTLKLSINLTQHNITHIDT